MRLGAELRQEAAGPDEWVAALQARGYRAAIWPLGGDPADDVVAAYVQAAEAADIRIAEVGAWSNPLSIDEAERRAKIARCQARLALADRIGAACCVNVAGSRGPRWCGPHPDDLTDATFELLVETVRTIVDAVRPTRTFYTIETMPWMVPDSPASYLRLIRAVDRPGFAAHLDPVNMINTPARYFRNADFLRACFETLGPYIKSCHAKDTWLGDKLTVHLSERPPGKGALDYRTYLTCVEALGPDTPLLMEHFTEADFAESAAFLRGEAAALGLST